MSQALRVQRLGTGVQQTVFRRCAARWGAHGLTRGRHSGEPAQSIGGPTMRTFKALPGVGLAASDVRGTMQRLVVILSAVTAPAVSGVAAAPASAGTEVLGPGQVL